MILWKTRPGRVNGALKRKIERRIWDGPVPVWYLDTVVEAEAWWLDHGPHFWLELHFEPRDLWIGVYHDRPDVSWTWARDFWICPVPMLALRVMVRRA